MVVLNKIYTRTGDEGTTALGTGQRLPKHDLRIETYGTTDELNAVVGLARLHAGPVPGMDEMLGRIQNDIFDLGADLCIPPNEPLPEMMEGYEPLRIGEEQVARLEREIDAMNKEMAPLNSFILPGGSPLAAHLHLARTVSRRAERIMTALKERDPEGVGAPALKYVNRLSDFFFVAARHANQGGKDDILWVPGANR